MSTVTLAVTLLVGSTLFAADPFVGVWKLDRAKSSGTIPKAETVIIQEESGQLKIRLQITISDQSGSPLTIVYSVPSGGGIGHVEKGPYDGISVRRAKKLEMETTYLSRGRKIRSAHAVVGNDEKSMNSTGEGIDDQGNPISWVMVFEKQ